MAGEAQTSFFWRELSCQITHATLVKRVTTHSYSKHVYRNYRVLHICVCFFNVYLLLPLWKETFNAVLTIR